MNAFNKKYSIRKEEIDLSDQAILEIPSIDPNHTTPLSKGNEILQGGVVHPAKPAIPAIPAIRTNQPAVPCLEIV